MPDKKPKAGKDSTKAGKDTRELPTQYFNSREETTTGQSLFPVTISDEQYSYLANRSAIGNRILNKLADDCFGKWFTISSESEEKVKAMEEFNERLKVKDKFYVGFKFTKTWGYSLLSLGFIETGGVGGDEQAALPPTNVTGIEYIYPIMKERVSEWDEDLDPTSKTYGDIRCWVKILIPL